MRIAYFYRDLLAGDTGRARGTSCMMKGMGEHGIDVLGYCYTADPSEDGVQEVNGLSVRAFYVPKWMRQYNSLHVPSALRRVLEANKEAIDAVVLVGGFVPANSPVARLLVRLGIPYVIEPHEAFNPNSYRGLQGLYKRAYETLFERLVIEQAAGVRLISDVQREHLAARGFRVHPEACFVTKDGIDWEVMEEELNGLPLPRQALHQSEEEEVFCFLGRLSIYKKGLDVLLEAWALYQRQGGTGRLKIAGPEKNDDAQKLRTLCRTLEVDRVEILPEQKGPEKFYYLQHASLLVHPSRHEIIPRVLREAIGVGCPVLVTEHTNLHDLVEETGAGFVARLDPEDIAEKLLRYQRMTRREKALMRRGARAAAAELDYTRTAGRYVEEIRRRLVPFNALRALPAF